MTPVPATLDVTFNSNYAGLHRVCYAIAPSTSYDCSNTVVCLGGGAPCSVSIPITVENDSCTAVTYQGYVQAGCEDPSSLSGRIGFSVTFTPNPDCKSYRVTCVGPTAPAQTLGDSCDGSPADVLSSMSVGQSAIFCMASVPTALPEYTIVEDGCCFECNSVSITLDVLSAPADFYYTDCTTHELTSVSLNPGDSSGPTCMVKNSWFIDPPTAIGIISVGATCP